ncbi:hypothetical protein BDW62DRAFT_184128 [Aspergillus aurantiobrunneus]
MKWFFYYTKTSLVMSSQTPGVVTLLLPNYTVALFWTVRHLDQPRARHCKRRSRRRRAIA